VPLWFNCSCIFKAALRGSAGLLAVFIVLFVAACRAEAVTDDGSSQQPPTPTPVSTPLPPLPTVIAVGQPENPLRMVMRLDGGEAQANAAADNLEAALLERAGVTVDVQLVKREAEAIAALCESFGGTAATAWLSGTAYLAAQALDCGQPELQVTRGENGATGSAAAIIVNAEAEIATFAALAGKTFCRVGSSDAYSWLIPALMMRAAGLLPTDLGATRDYDSATEAAKAVNAGACDAAGIPTGVLERLDSGDIANIATLETSIPIPYSILMIPRAVPLGTRTALVETLNRLADERDSAIWLRDLLGQETLVPAAPDDFAELLAFGVSTGLDFAVLGQ
jgi:ABC-type phosphate/phosphonate transport system substrate-binding protein